MNKIEKMVSEYKDAVKNNDTTKIREIEEFFIEIGIEPLGLRIIAFT
ncbi:MAG: hypothetical protein HDQ99_02970 [Lachnospiraceae bacterium]|nr:hypothetical protein [Lachnospiraceae bacterium]